MPTKLAKCQLNPHDRLYDTPSHYVIITETKQKLEVVEKYSSAE